MANEEQLAILRQGGEVWNEWRNEHEEAEIDLRGANLRKIELYLAELDGSDLRGANLQGVDLTGINLVGANLSGANLRKVDLGGADLRDVDLNQADLEEANLFNADLSGVDLSGANLCEVKLIRTNIFAATLNETNLKKAYCGETVFNNLDLSTVKGLETIEHLGPSYLDIQTLYRSQGKIPEIFLRGCGVPEEFIRYIPSLTGKAIEFYSCFISYNHQDKAFARRMHDTLQGRGIRCWLDEKQMNPGDDIYREIERGIRYWDKVILCASQHSLKSWWVDTELNRLFKKEQDLMRERGEKVLALIPLDLDGHLLSKEYQGDKKTEITSRLAADFKGWEHDNAIFEREIERVIKALRTDGGKELPPPARL